MRCAGFGVLPPGPAFRSSRSTHPLLGRRDVNLPFTFRGWPKKPVRASPLHNGLQSHLWLLAETVRAGEKNLHEPDACVSAEGE
jgi:hypothetical protein